MVRVSEPREYQPGNVNVRSKAPGPGRFSRWVLPVAATVISVGAVGVAVWALMHPRPASTPSDPSAPSAPSAQQVADAKTRACTAFKTVRTAVALQTHVNPGDNPVAAQAIAANARAAMFSGGTLLLDRLEPATPEPLAGAVRGFADDLQEIALNAWAGVGNDDPAQAARLRDGDAANTRIAELCK
jgi:hypothetical protein